MADILTGLGLGMTSDLLNFALGLNREEIAAERQYSYSEQAADNADKRTRKLYSDFMSPEALLQQYKSAGLSPSLMFGGGGIGGQTPHGAQGAGSAQGSTYQPIDPVSAANISLMNAQADKAKAEADTIKGENERGQAEIDNLIEDTKNKKLIGTYQDCKNKIEDINLQIAEATKGNKIQISEYTEYMLNGQLMMLDEQLAQEENKRDISDATKEDVIKKIKTEALQAEATLALTRAEKRLKEAGVNLTNKQIEDISSTITKRAWDMRTELYDRKMELKQWEIECKKWCIEAGIDVDKMTAQGAGLMVGILATTLTKFPMGGTTVTGFR